MSTQYTAKIEEEIFDDVTKLCHYYSHKDKLRYIWFLTKLELDLAEYYSMMKTEHPKEKELLDHYSKLWEF